MNISLSSESSSWNISDTTLLLNDTLVISNTFAQKLDQQKAKSQIKNKVGLKSIVVNSKAKLRQQQRKQLLKENTFEFHQILKYMIMTKI